MADFYYEDIDSMVLAMATLITIDATCDSQQACEAFHNLFCERIRAIVSNGMLRDLRYDVAAEFDISIYTHHQDFEAGDTPTNIVMRYELSGQDITHNFYLESDQ